MNQTNIAVGPFCVNCHLLWDQQTNTGLIIDPGDDGAEIITAVDEIGFTPAGVLLTHAHVDHIRAVGAVAEYYGVQVWLHPDDREMYFSSDNCILPWLPAAENLPEIGVVPNDLPGLKFTIIHTPGHTPGCCCFYFADSAILVSGDTIFADGIGRTDLPGGDFETLANSIKAKLFTLPGQVTVLPGHGGSTTLTAARRNIEAFMM